MADHFVQGTVFPDLILDEVVKSLLSTGGDEDLPSEVYAAIPSDWAAPYGGETHLVEEVGWVLSAFNVETDKKEGTSYIYFDDMPDTEIAAEVLQWILSRNPERFKYVILEGAMTCSKMRQGEFGGFAYFITRSDIRSISTGEWITERISEMEGE
jgi:hypothetical protein